MMKIRLMLAAALICANGAAFAETRIFLLESTGGYGVDTCLANGEPCGETLASAWCRAHDYTRAIDFGQVTGSISAPNPLRPVASADAADPRGGCSGNFCPSMVAITCTR